MLLRSASALVVATFAAAAPAQFPLGPGNVGAQPVVDPAINEYICRAVVEHAISSNLHPIRGTQVELVSARWQGELVYVFCRVHWTTKHLWSRTPIAHVAEVQYSMVQRRFKHCVYELWCRDTGPRIYQYYDLGRVRTKINEELYRFDQIAGDSVFPGPYPRGPSTIVPQISTANPNVPPAPQNAQPVKIIDEPIVVPSPGVSPPDIAPRREPPVPIPMPPSSTGTPQRFPPPRPMK
jgi:hypothetical protein